MSLYKGVILEHFRRPLNRGDLAGATAAGDAANPLCGDRIRISVSVAGDLIADIGFSGDACAICVASASLLTERVRGTAVQAAGSIDEQSVVASLESDIPHTRVRCATLPLDALRRAIRIYPDRMEAAAIVLAAGRSSRFGADKLTATLDGAPLVAHVVAALEGMVGRTVVVAGENAVDVRLALRETAATIVENPRARDGMSTSIVTGLEQVRDYSAVLVMLGDQPRIERSTVAAVLDAWRAGQGDIVVPSYRGLRAPPALFGSRLFDDLHGLSGDSGARVIIERHPDMVAVVEIDRDPPVDVDTKSDLERLGRGEA